MNLPNKLTLLRIALAFVFIALLSFENLACLIVGYVVFVMASITDYYDGKIARARNLVTNFGKLVDPVADKILVVAAFIMLMLLDDLHIPGWTVVVILGREFLITGARSLAAIDGIVIAANKYGKAKAVFQMVYICSFLAFVIIKDILQFIYPEAVPVYGAILRPFSMWAAVAVALYTVYTGYQFARLNWRSLKLDNM